jgi:uncharacterized coiled-coil protein SlyX
MPSEDEQNKDRSKISLKIGDVQVELEGTYDNIKKLMNRELYDFAKGLEETTKHVPSSTETAPKITPKAPEVAPKEKTVPPPSKPSTTQAPSQPSRLPTIEKKPEKMGKKKILSRNAAIALALVLVLLASLVSVIAIYVPMVSDLNSQIAEKDDTIASLSSQVSAIQSVLNQLAANLTVKDNQIANLTSSLSSLTAEYNAVISEYNTIFALGKTENMYNSYPISQEENSSTVLFNDILQYAGYVTVAAQSTSNTTYAAVAYSSHGVEYNNNVTLGESGGAAFPILPGTVLISIGNTDTGTGETVNATVTVNYVY